MPEDNPKGGRDPSAVGNTGGISDSTSPSAGKKSVHRPGHKSTEPSGTERGPVRKRRPEEVEADVDAIESADMPPGPLTPGTRA